MSDIDTQKADDRKLAIARRDRAFAEAPDAGLDLACHVMEHADELGLSDGRRTVSLFWSMGAEINMQPLLEALHHAGHVTVLPVVVKRASPLVFRVWAPGDPLIDGGFGTSIPASDADECAPDILFVPLLAFDGDGYRLGYGGGFYDRTLEKLRLSGNPMSVGVAFSAQRVDTVPRGPHDQRLDWIATEAGLVRVPG